MLPDPTDPCDKESCDKEGPARSSGMEAEGEASPRSTQGVHSCLGPGGRVLTHAFDFLHSDARQDSGKGNIQVSSYKFKPHRGEKLPHTDLDKQ